MGIVILFILSIILYKMGSSIKQVKKEYLDSEEFYVHYHKVIFKNPIQYRVEGERLFARQCDICKTIHGDCPIMLKSKYNYNSNNCPATLKDYYNYLR